MAAAWIPCGSGFIEADVIRWNEGVWQKPRRNRGRAVNIGDRVVIAEVIRDDGEWVDLLIRDCTIASEKPGRKVLPLAKNAAVRRKRHTVAKGKPERLLWSDETVRALLASRLLGGDNPSTSEEASPSYAPRDREAHRTATREKVMGNIGADRKTFHVLGGQGYR